LTVLSVGSERLQTLHYLESVLNDLRAPDRGATAVTGQPEGKATKPKRGGRASDTDRKADNRIADAWKTGQYKTYAECGQALGMTRRQVKTAVDRHRKR
jgi:hypothetical protein